MLYNPSLSPAALEVLDAVQEVAKTLQRKEDPTYEQLRAVAEKIETHQGTTDLDPRHPQINQMLTAWNQILLGCLMKQFGETAYTGLIDAVYVDRGLAAESYKQLAFLNDEVVNDAEEHWPDLTELAGKLAERFDTTLVEKEQPRADQ